MLTAVDNAPAKALVLVTPAQLLQALAFFANGPVEDWTEEIALAETEDGLIAYDIEYPEEGGVNLDRDYEQEASEWPSLTELSKLLRQNNRKFSEWADEQPAKHWAKYDLSALRLGFELGCRVGPQGLDYIEWTEAMRRE